MCQAVLSPNLTKKFQWEVSQIANNRFPVVMLLGGLSVNLNHLKRVVSLESGDIPVFDVTEGGQVNCKNERVLYDNILIEDISSDDDLDNL